MQLGLQAAGSRPQWPKPLAGEEHEADVMFR